MSLVRREFPMVCIIFFEPPESPVQSVPLFLDAVKIQDRHTEFRHHLVEGGKSNLTDLLEEGRKTLLDSIKGDGSNFNLIQEAMHQCIKQFHDSSLQLLRYNKIT